eukprot:5522468-Pleurochrysis_carterae.AAC.2
MRLDVALPHEARRACAHVRIHTRASMRRAVSELFRSASEGSTKGRDQQKRRARASACAAGRIGWGGSPRPFGLRTRSDLEVIVPNRPSERNMAA